MAVLAPRCLVGRLGHGSPEAGRRLPERANKNP